MFISAPRPGQFFFQSEQADIFFLFDQLQFHVKYIFNTILTQHNNNIFLFSFSHFSFLSESGYLHFSVKYATVIIYIIPVYLSGHLSSISVSFCSLQMIECTHQKQASKIVRESLKTTSKLIKIEERIRLRLNFLLHGPERP